MRKDLREYLCCSFDGHHLRVWREDGMDGISWDELQAMKNLVAGEDETCIEVFPPAGEVVNDANIRHLWVVSKIPEGCDLAWSKRGFARVSQ